jgi:hypothetical protein
LRLTTAVASDTSHVEDSISAELTNPVTIDGREVLPAGAKVTGVVATADGAGRVKGRAQVALLFTSVSGGGQRYGINTELFSRQASATKGEDATKIGIGAGAGAAIGAILGERRAQPRVRPSAVAPVLASCWPPRETRCASLQAPTSRHG